MYEELIGPLLDIGNVIFFVFGFPQLLSTFKNRKNLKGLSPTTIFGYSIACIFFFICGILSHGYLTAILCTVNIICWAMQIYWMKPKLNWCWILRHKWGYLPFKKGEFCVRCKKPKRK